MCLGPEACSRQGQRSHNNSSAIVQPLFGLAELSKFRIWPQRNAEPTNLSRGIRKSPQHMRFMGSQQSLHISSHPKTACATLSVFFPSVWVCYLFIHYFCPFVQSLICHKSGFLLSLSMGNFCDGGHGGLTKNKSN